MSFINFLRRHVTLGPNTVENREEALETFKSAMIVYVKTRIRELRGIKNQTLVAEEAGLRQPAISRIENVDNTRLSLNSLHLIAAALDAVVVIEIRPRSEIIAEMQEAAK